MPAPLTLQEIERWNRVLAAAAKLQSVILEAFLVGGTVVSIHVPYQPLNILWYQCHSFHGGRIGHDFGTGHEACRCACSDRVGLFPHALISA